MVGSSGLMIAAGGAIFHPVCRTERSTARFLLRRLQRFSDRLPPPSVYFASSKAPFMPALKLWGVGLKIKIVKPWRTSC